MSTEKAQNPRERFLRIVARRPADRPAVICPGGMMSMATQDIMAASGATWPAAHYEQSAMIRLALAMQEATGFDNLSLPFCMTVECQAYGCDINFGDLSAQPRATRPILAADGGSELRRLDFSRCGPAADHDAVVPGTLQQPGPARLAMVLDAMRQVRQARPDLLLIGNLCGPFSILGELAEAGVLLRWTRRRPELVHRYMDQITADLVAFARLQVQAGADVICVAEPTATGEILGGTLFERFVLPYLNRLAAELSGEARLIVHICGNISAIAPQLRRLAVDAMSFDSCVDLVALKATNPPWLVMGNISGLLLESGSADRIRQQCCRLAEGGVELLAPCCGVVPTTPAANLQAMRQAADEFREPA